MGQITYNHGKTQHERSSSTWYVNNADFGYLKHSKWSGYCQAMMGTSHYARAHLHTAKTTSRENIEDQHANGVLSIGRFPSKFYVLNANTPTSWISPLGIRREQKILHRQPKALSIGEKPPWRK
jgi:hypothetical protein